jgi:hypothetical protein
MVHVKKVEKIQYLIESNPVSLNIIRTGCILLDECADDGEDGEQNEERDSEFEGTKKIEEYGKESPFFSAVFSFRLFHLPSIKMELADHNLNSNYPIPNSKQIPITQYSNNQKENQSILVFEFRSLRFWLLFDYLPAGRPSTVLVQGRRGSD